MENITIISYGQFEEKFLKKVSGMVSNEFQSPVILKNGNMNLENYYDAKRRQYNGDQLLKEVDSQYHFNSLKTLGLFNIDLFIPILTYIFGQAYLNGKSGIVSIHRLKNERYGMAPDEDLLISRTTKEIVHELGHTFGLKHCFNPICVMRSSTYVEDLDQKNEMFCTDCKTKL